MKKIFCLILTLVMMLSLGVTAFAAGADGSSEPGRAGGVVGDLIDTAGKVYTYGYVSAGGAGHYYVSYIAGIEVDRTFRAHSFNSSGKCACGYTNPSAVTPTETPEPSPAPSPAPDPGKDPGSGNNTPGGNNGGGNNGSGNNGSGNNSGTSAAGGILYGNGAGKFGNHYYLIVPETLSWEEADDVAGSVAGYLVTITSAKEQAFIEALNAGNDNLWIGSESIGSSWGWVTRESWEYANWESGYPVSASSETHGALSCKKWVNLKCEDTDSLRGFILEFDEEVPFNNARTLLAGGTLVSSGSKSAAEDQDELNPAEAEEALEAEETAEEEEVMDEETGESMDESSEKSSVSTFVWIALGVISVAAVAGIAVVILKEGKKK